MAPETATQGGGRKLTDIVEGCGTVKSPWQVTIEFRLAAAPWAAGYGY